MQVSTRQEEHMLLITIALLTLAYGVFNASLVEWLLHRFVMHRPLFKFRYPYEAHALTHHQIFKADNTYHCSDIAIRHKIRMAWWNGPVIVILGMLPFYMGALPFVLSGWTAAAYVIMGCGLAVSASYYGAYEYLHWCMHSPKGRWFEGTKLFRRINGHHVLHHRYPNKNFNVVLPLIDWVSRTILYRSKVCFAQVRGPSVPDVQPIAA